ncbi:MAG: hypothetical protein J7623_13235 [Chitinophaga sp.]|uniref:hypothetical protein n=1 Tax=Chitinophaga sp. TaxID=1869181 RepID=UPI001B1224C1|nr:hypothetical protein [Chitinophaga sp.]MBO9729595.1 hypothetical protein [Chitinophaga sp.]
MRKLLIGASALLLTFAVNQSIANGHKDKRVTKKAKVDCTNCNAEYQKCINNVCTRSIRWYTSSVLISTRPNRYKCTYHYEWIDGTISQDYYEYASFPCALM